MHVLPDAIHVGRKFVVPGDLLLVKPNFVSQLRIALQVVDITLYRQTELFAQRVIWTIVDFVELLGQCLQELVDRDVGDRVFQ